MASIELICNTNDLLQLRELESSPVPMDISHFADMEIDDYEHVCAAVLQGAVMPWEVLPPEMRRYILTFLSAIDLCKGASVCKEWADVSNDDSIWRTFYLQIASVCSMNNTTGDDAASKIPNQIKPGFIDDKPQDKTWKWRYMSKMRLYTPGSAITVGYVEEPKGRYEGEWSDDKFNGVGYYTWKDNVTYQGEFKDGMLHGNGKMVWTNGDTYEGSWQCDLKDGFGCFIWANGDKYVGGYQNNKKHGYGTITWGSHPGESYHGSWKEDKKDGMGTYDWPNGGSYIGEWKNNKRHGKGREVWVSGSVYEGEWVEDAMSGFGRKTCTRDGQPDGVYEGPFKDGRANGRGHRQYTDGSVYEGEYVDDKRVGRGTYTWPNGDRFEGEWKVGRWKGQFITSCSEVYQQEWFETQFDKNVKGIEGRNSNHGRKFQNNSFHSI